MYKLTFWDRLSLWWSRNVKDRIYRWKCRLWKKYNVVRIKSLEPTWNDRDAVLAHAMFQILTDFMEKEKPGERIDWSYNEEHAHAWKEMTELYDWWHNVYLKFDPWNPPMIPNELDPIIGVKVTEDGRHLADVSWPSKEKEGAWHEAWKDQLAAEENMNRQLEENCIRLVKIRPYLWT